MFKWLWVSRKKYEAHLAFVRADIARLINENARLQICLEAAPTTPVTAVSVPQFQPVKGEKTLASVRKGHPDYDGYTLTETPETITVSFSAKNKPAATRTAALKAGKKSVLTVRSAISFGSRRRLPLEEAQPVTIGSVITIRAPC